MREHHALRHAGAAAREDDRRERIRVRLRRRSRRSSSAAGSAVRGDQRADSSKPRRRRVRRSSRNTMPRHRGKACFRQERLRRQNRGDAAALDRGGHRVAAGGEVQVDRDLAGERDRDVGERAADRCRQQQADRACRPGAAGGSHARAAGCRPARARRSARGRSNRPCRTTTTGAWPCGGSGRPACPASCTPPILRRGHSNRGANLELEAKAENLANLRTLRALENLCLYQCVTQPARCSSRSWPSASAQRLLRATAIAARTPGAVVEELNLDAARIGPVAELRVNPRVLLANAPHADVRHYCSGAAG